MSFNVFLFLDYYFPVVTFLNVLVAVEGDDGVVVADAAKGVDEMGAQVGVDVTWRELGISGSKKCIMY